MSKPARTLPPAYALTFITIVLCLLGLLFVFEASVAEAYANFGNQFYFVRQQVLWLGVGIAGAVFAAIMPARVWQKFGPLLYWLSIFLLCAVFLPGIGRTVNGARRWLALGSFALQPVELVKFGVVAFFSSWMVRHQKLVSFLFLTIVPTFLLLLQPDMGSAIIVIAIAFGLYFLSGAALKTFGAIGGLGVLALFLLIIISPYRSRRLTTFLNPESDPLGASFHIRQITLALGNGGVFGQGLGKSRQKYSYLPEASTDSIFAIVAEEVGFVGASVICLLFGSYIFFGYKITQQLRPRTYEHLFASGILLWLSAQILVNLAAIVALVPLTGIPLPFFSYGGTSLVMVLWGTGILIGLGLRAQSNKIT